VLAVEGADELLSQWGATDFMLYDTYVAGHVDTVLTDVRPDARLSLSPNSRSAQSGQ